MDESMAQGGDGHTAGDPAQAFEALRAEVAGLAQMLEAFGGRLSDQRPIDYTPTLEEFAQAQQAVASRLARIEKHPALNLGPKQLQAEIALASTSLMSEAVRQVQEASGRVSHEASQLQGLYAHIQTQRNHWQQIAWSTAAALVLGILLCPFLARLLPFGLDSRIAALVMHQDRWNAGAQLMEGGNPDSWRSLRIAEQLVRANQSAIEQCQATAMKAKKEQRCSITVGADR